ncbi:hypothetical protein M0R72_08345 [Candidatus Pacearchaeota archaeon]|jgi:hypothetical protein|nr:hypothetical protein [Candidatus Pacearchaeota archaeon]
MEELRAKIEAAFDNVVNARKGLLDAKEATLTAKENLKYCEAALFEDGLVTGSNDKAREASIRSQTKHIRADMEKAEKEERVATLALEIALDARRNLESMLRIEELEAT